MIDKNIRQNYRKIYENYMDGNDDDNLKRDYLPENKKIEGNKLEKLLHFSVSQSKFFIHSWKSAKNFYFDLINLKDEFTRRIFYILIFLFWIEHLLINLSGNILVKITISALMLLPFFIMVFENPNLASLSSIFEMRILITLKLLIILSKKMNFIQLFVSAIFLNMYECYFIKVLYLKNNYLGTELKNKNLRKANEFKFSFKILTFGYLISSTWFYLMCDKLEFHLIDDILSEFYYSEEKEKKLIYFTLLILLCSKTLFKNLWKISKSSHSHNIIKNPQKYFFYYFVFYLGLSYTYIWSILPIVKILLLFALVLAVFYLIGYFFILLIMIYYLKIIIFKKFLFINFTQNYKIDLNFLSSNISLILSLLFMIILYKENEIVKVYYKIYEKIFLMQILFDVGLIINFISRIYELNRDNYLEIFNNTYHIFFLSLAIQYIVIFLAVYLKLNLKIEESTLNSIFGEAKINSLDYNRSTPYFEIKLNKWLKNLASHYLIKMDNTKKYALKKISTFIILIVFILVCCILNNSKIFFVIYIIIIQLSNKTYLKEYIKRFVKFFKFLYRINFKEDFSFTSYREAFQSMMLIYKNSVYDNKEIKEKCKLVYIYLFPYILLGWKIILIKILIWGYEIYFSFITQFIGELDPISNVIYNTLISDNNSCDYSYSSLDIFTLLIFILPNTLINIYSHVNNKNLNFFMLNYSVLNFAGLFLNCNIDIVITGILNLIISITIMIADSETYYQFSVWFDFLGIQPCL